MKGIIFDIQRNSFVDGPGIRTTVFFKGCNLKCKWCHNPESQAFERQMMFFKSKCTGCGKCKEVCPYNFEKCDFCGKCTLYCPADAREICGKEVGIEEVLCEVLKDKAFYENSGGGVTFSGGECMLQLNFLEELLKKCKEEELHTAVDTAGNVPFEHFDRVIPYTDLFLYDVKCLSEDLHKEGTGVSNKRILENLKKLSEAFKGDIIVRIPVISGYNETELEAIAKFLNPLNVKNVELLPYHKMGEHKYDALNMLSYTFEVPPEEKMNRYKEMFK